MLTHSQAEWGLVLSLLRGDEPPDCAIDRLDSITPRPSLTNIKDPKARAILELVLHNAARERATSVRLAAAKAGLEETDLLNRLHTVDPDSVCLYAEQVLEHAEGAQIASAADEAGRLARKGKAQEALDTLAEKLDALQRASEESVISTVPEATMYFLKWYQTFQEEAKSGKPRFSLIFDELNEMIPYIFPGHAILVSAQSKIGKSSFVQQLFDFNCARGLKGLLFHFEDTTEEMGIKRTARQMILQRDNLGNYIGLSNSKLLGVLTDDELGMVSAVNAKALRWKPNGEQISCAGWTMNQVAHVIQQRRKKIDFFIVDYIGKEAIEPRNLRHLGLWSSRAKNAELLKTMALRHRLVGVIVQQEHGGEKRGSLFGSKETWQKFQVWLSLSRKRLDDESLSGTYRVGIANKNRDFDGKIVVKSANMGRTGQIGAWFYPEFGLWGA